MGLIRVKRSTYECDDLLFHNHGGAPLHSQGRQRRAAKVMRWTACGTSSISCARHFRLHV